MLTSLFLLMCSANPTAIQSLQDELRAHPWRYSGGIATSSAVVAPVSPAQVPATAPSSREGGWSIQLGALSTEDAATKRKDELESTLGKGSVSMQPSGSTWKLRTGGFADRKAAQKAKEELKKKGIDGFVVEP